MKLNKRQCEVFRAHRERRKGAEDLGQASSVGDVARGHGGGRDAGSSQGGAGGGSVYKSYRKRDTRAALADCSYPSS